MNRDPVKSSIVVPHGAFRTLSLPAVLVLTLVGLACEPSTKSKLDQPIDAPESAHPAMDDPSASSTAGQMPAGHGSSGSLPAGHPPIGASSSSTASSTEESTESEPADSSASDSGDAASSGATSADGGTVAISGVTFEVPEGLVREQPSSSMRLAQFRLPAAEGATDETVMTVIQAGGSLQGNIDRWRGQFEGSPEATTEKRTVDNGAVTVVQIEGTFKGMSGPFAGGGEPKSGQALWGAIVESPKIRGGSLFLKATGPKETIDRWSEQLRELAGSIAVP